MLNYQRVTIPLIQNGKIKCIPFIIIYPHIIKSESIFRPSYYLVDFNSSHRISYISIRLYANDINLYKSIPRCSMLLEYLPTFTPKLAQSCRKMFSNMEHPGWLSHENPSISPSARSRTSTVAFSAAGTGVPWYLGRSPREHWGFDQPKRCSYGHGY